MMIAQPKNTNIDFQGKMISRRKMAIISAGFGMSTLFRVLPAGAQAPSPPSNRPPPPAETLPGPFGPFGGPGGGGAIGDGSKEAMSDMADSIEISGGLGIGLGGLFMGLGGIVIGGTCIETGGAGCLVGGVIVGGGFGLGVIGVSYTALAQILRNAAEDPPRSNYKIQPSCRAGSVYAFAPFNTIPQNMRSSVNATLRLYAASGSMLASLELWQGAHRANDSRWRRIHRRNFVRYWNEMRKELRVSAAAFNRAYVLLNKEIARKNLTRKKLNNYAAANNAKIRRAAAQQFSYIPKIVGRTCKSENAFIENAVSKFNLPSRPYPSARAVRSSLTRQQVRANKIPSYK